MIYHKSRSYLKKKALPSEIQLKQIRKELIAQLVTTSVNGYSSLGYELQWIDSSLIQRDIEAATWIC